ncbi:uncharacterized protein LOC106165700 [Lingula anatina]|uniref:alcohol dehydrogenase n=1 Tax=Lingula anatina TaxID=7574 RepID=A0A1S3IMK1_LINAN|nr:uncharacterized protein LOC106165700 [Lingula anatina]|eukprot:XP_013399465.1 uncharacterized protein LOC106165700 [Lingula anatina]
MAKCTRVVFVGAEHNPCCLIDDCTVPTIGDGEVLVKVLLATVCGSDLHTISGQRKEATPSVLGHEAVAEIVTINRNASKFSPGDRVTFTVVDFCGECARCKGGLVQKCTRLFKYGHAQLADGTGFNGCYATHIVLRPGTHLVKIPDHVTDRMAAPINCALATMVNVMNSIPSIGDNKANHVALIQGAGLLGLYGCALLQDRGYQKVYCVDINRDRLTLVPLFGGIPNFISGNELTIDIDPDSVDTVIEVCGSPNVIQQGISLLRPGGTYLMVGMVHPNSKLNLTGEQIIRKCLTIKGIHNYGPADLEQAVEFISRTANKYPFERLVGGEEYSLRDITDAIKEAELRKYLRVAVKP